MVGFTIPRVLSNIIFGYYDFPKIIFVNGKGKKIKHYENKYPSILNMRIKNGSLGMGYNEKDGPIKMVFNEPKLNKLYKY